MNQAPSNGQWQRLTAAASEFYKIAPWEWMDDTVFFGIQAPGTETVDYGCIMGKGGEHFALALYRGEAGLHSYIALRDGTQGMDPFSTYHLQDCLMASFELPEDLDDTDREILRAAAPAAGEPKRLPQFRSLRPRQVPWYLTADEADTLAYGLAAAAAVALLVRGTPDMLYGGQEADIPVFSFGRDGSLVHRFTRVAGYVPPVPALELKDEDLIRRLKETPADPETVWVVRSFVGPIPVMEAERPVFPTLVVWFDQAREQVMHIETCADLVQGAETVLQSTVALIGHQKRRPGTLLVTEPAVEALLGRLSRQLDIPLGLQEAIPQIEAVIEDFHRHFGN